MHMRKTQKYLTWRASPPRCFSQWTDSQVLHGREISIENFCLMNPSQPLVGPHLPMIPAGLWLKDHQKPSNPDCQVVTSYLIYCGSLSLKRGFKMSIKCSAHWHQGAEDRLDLSITHEMIVTSMLSWRLCFSKLIAAASCIVIQEVFSHFHNFQIKKGTENILFKMSSQIFLSGDRQEVFCLFICLFAVKGPAWVILPSPYTERP